MCIEALDHSSRASTTDQPSGVRPAPARAVLALLIELGWLAFAD